LTLISVSTIVFWLRGRPQLALGESDLALEEIKRHLLDFIATHTWEELCREWTVRAGARGQLDLPVDQVGSAWTRQAQVDVAALNSMEKTILLGECKWQTRPVGQSVLRELVGKSDKLVPKQGRWRLAYLGFAREGWTEAAQLFAGNLSELALPAHANWRPVGMRLLDLSQVDTDLRQWVRRDD
jgi:uncharacterized protein